MVIKKLPLFLLFFVGACSVDLPITEEISVSREIGFNVETQSTRAGLIQGRDDVLTMGVYGSYSPLDFDPSINIYNNFMDNVLVARSSSTAPFTYSPKLFWPPVGKLSFFSYAPYDSTVEGVAIEEGMAGGMGYPELTYLVPDQVNRHVDLLQGKEMNMSAEVVVPAAVVLQYKHVVSCIDFGAKITGVSSPGTEMRISQIRLEGIRNKGALSFADGADWVLDPTSVANWDLSIAGGTLRNVVLTSTTQPLTLSTEMMMPIPQTVADDVVLVVVASVVDNNGIADRIVNRMPLNEVIPQLEMSKRYKITISYGLGQISLSYEVVPWVPYDITLPPFS